MKAISRTYPREMTVLSKTYSNTVEAYKVLDAQFCLSKQIKYFTELEYLP